MNFFEKPKLVTAVVFFAETILCLFKVEYFLYLNISSLLLSLILLSVLPLGFHAVYSYILNDMTELPKKKLGIAPKDGTENRLDKHADVHETKEMQKEVVESDDVVEVMEKEEMNHVKEMENKNPENVVEDVERDTAIVPQPQDSEENHESQKNQKKIQILTSEEIYLEDEAKVLPRTRSERKQRK